MRLGQCADGGAGEKWFSFLQDVILARVGQARSTAKGITGDGHIQVAGLSQQMVAPAPLSQISRTEGPSGPAPSPVASWRLFRVCSRFCHSFPALHAGPGSSTWLAASSTLRIRQENRLCGL